MAGAAFPLIPLMVRSFLQDNAYPMGHCPKPAGGPAFGIAVGNWEQMFPFQAKKYRS
jgi:hypothetical protein